MHNIAVITARGGSKRIPRKNIKIFCGQPILAYSINVALESKLFDEVMVSTEDEEIADIARSYGAKVPFLRSEKNSNDFATTEEVLCEVLEMYNQKGDTFEFLSCIYPTAPFITANILKKAFEFFQNSEADALIPVAKFSYPPQRCFVLREEKLSYKWPEYMSSRSQDLEPYYHDVGQFYFWRADRFINTKGDFLEATIPYIMNENEVQDIDAMDDWDLAELKWTNMKNRKSLDLGRI